MGEQEPKAVLSGELVWQQNADRTRRAKYTANLDDDTVAEIIRGKVSGRTFRDLSQSYGVSERTIRDWMSDAHAARKRRPIEDIRADLFLEAETAAAAAWDVVRGAMDPKTRLDALLRVESLIRTRSTLAGANQPVRHDVTIQVVTDAERELQEMITLAKAQTALREKAVINAATEDTEL